MKLPLAWDGLKMEHLSREVGEMSCPGWTAGGAMVRGDT